MRKYRLVAKKGEGTFSEVLKAQNVKDGKYHALKCMKSKFDSIDQVIIFTILTCEMKSQNLKKKGIHHL
jgi:serine/threonine protein kinase